jgi:hypothetical protein
MLNNPFCFVIEHENTIQMVKLNELKIWAKVCFLKLTKLTKKARTRKDTLLIYR